ncbi:MAG: hypothetical protein CME38_00235 [Haliea sp.]|nr:hypothetical protein [Haliea sp.]
MYSENAVLSVVIPAFNAEMYIRDCLNSVVIQPDSSLYLRVIVVVDGATDNTLRIANEVAIQSNVHIVTILQDRGGPATARNKGLEYVDTPYVTFLDADDKWSEDYLRVILEALCQDPDLVEYDAFKSFGESDEGVLLKIARADVGTQDVCEPSDFLEKFRCYAWARVYRTSMVKAHLFPEGRRYEDTATTPWYYWKSNKIISIGRALIIYRQHSGSIMANPSPIDVENIIDAVREAASMYFKTRSFYWQVVTWRIHQFACQRITTQKVCSWRRFVLLSKSSISGVPRPSGIARWLQGEFPMIYVAILSLKYLLERVFIGAIPVALYRQMLSRV